MQQNDQPINPVTIVQDANNSSRDHYSIPIPTESDNDPVSYMPSTNSVRSHNGDEGLALTEREAVVNEEPIMKKTEKMDSLMGFNFQKKKDPVVHDNSNDGKIKPVDLLAPPQKSKDGKMPSINLDVLEKKESKPFVNEGSSLLNRNYTMNNFKTGSERSILKANLLSEMSVMGSVRDMVEMSGSTHKRKVRFKPKAELSMIKEVEKVEYDGPQEWTLAPIKRDELEIEEDRIKDEYFKVDNTKEVNKYRADILMNMYFSKKPDQNPEIDPNMTRDQKNDLKDEMQLFIERFSNNLFCKFSNMLSEKKLTFKNYVRFRDKFRPIKRKLDKKYKVTKYGRNSLFSGDVRYVYLTHHGRYFGWSKFEKDEPKKEYSLHYFIEIKKGKETKIQKKFKKTDENNCLSIILNTRTIDLEMENIEEREELAYTLEKLIETRQFLNNDDELIVYASNYATFEVDND